MPKSRLWIVLVGLFALGSGLYPMLAAVGVIAAPESDFGGPRWLVFLAGSLFFLIGLFILAHLTGKDTRPLGAVLGFALLLGLAVIGHWIAFGPGVRECEGGISFGGVGVAGLRPDLECRIAFGYGALLLDLIVVVSLARHWAGRAAGDEQRFALGLAKAGEWGVGLLLLPLIALAAALGGLERLVTRLARGRQGKAAPRRRSGPPE